MRHILVVLALATACGDIGSSDCQITPADTSSALTGLRRCRGDVVVRDRLFTATMDEFSFEDGSAIVQCAVIADSTSFAQINVVPASIPERPCRTSFNAAPGEVGGRSEWSFLLRQDGTGDVAYIGGTGSGEQFGYFGVLACTTSSLSSHHDNLQ